MQEEFSRFVERLGRGVEELNREDFDEICERLRGLLVQEMRRRGLWSAPPAYLGVTASHWLEPGAFDELVLDLYVFIFVQRLGALIKQQANRPDVRPLVVLNVKHFVTERQRVSDPLGYRIFGRLRAAIIKCMELGRLFLQDEQDPGAASGSVAIGNRSRLTFRQGFFQRVHAALFGAPVRRWNDNLLPALVLAEGRSVPKVVRELRDHVLTLPRDGIEAFLFGDLIRAQKDDVRQRWRALWRQELNLGRDEGGGDQGTPAPLLVTEEETETERFWQERYRLALDDIALAIEQQTGGTVRSELWRLWVYLRELRFEDSETGPRATTPDRMAEELPSYVEIGRCLGISRKRVPKLLKTLRRIAETCLREAGGPESPSLGKRRRRAPQVDRNPRARHGARQGLELVNAAGRR